MLRKILERLLRHRHFWRSVGFDELSEIYVSMMFRSLAISLTNIFVPLYMLKLGYPIIAIMLTISWYFIFRAFLFDMFAGLLVSKIGPKHTILWSYLMLTLSSYLFLTLPQLHWPLWLVGGIWGGSTALFAIPFHVDFSKVKHREHGGKELGYVNIMEKVGHAVGPLVGGLIATFFGGQYIFLVSIAVLVLGSLPLLRTGEPTGTNQPFNLKSLKLKPIKRDVLSFMAYGIELTMCGSMWPLYLGLFVLAASGAAYAGLGILASASVIASMGAAFAIGKLIDRRRGRPLLRFGAIVNALLYGFRPLVSSYPGALLVNIVNDGVTTAYHMPYTKGMYDAADDLPGQRIAYFVAMEMISSAAKAVAWLSLVLLALVASNYKVIVVGFLMGGMASLLIMIEKFKALDA